MGRLYDRQDLNWNTDYWNRQEMRLSADIANGLMPASTLEGIVTYPGSTYPQPGWPKGLPARHVKLKDAFELERKRERMKLLRTGSLLRNLDQWRRMFLACAHCYSTQTSTGKHKDVPCDEHNEGLTSAKSAVYWAGEHNLEERASRGQIRTEAARTTQDALEGVPAEAGDNPLNKWESWYQRDKAAGIWTPQDAQREDVEPGYRGWLTMLWENEEMTEREYLGELDRLRQEARMQETGQAPTDRNNPRSLPKYAGRGRMSYRSDRAY